MARESSSGPWTSLGACVAVAAGLTVSAPASGQEFTATAHRSSLERGEQVEMTVRIRASDGDLDDLRIEPVVPVGFKIKPKSRDIAAVSEGSELAVPFVVTAPTWRIPKLFAPGAEQRTRGTSTRERKVFVFNVSYASESDGSRKQRFVEHSIRFTTSIYIYLLTGLIGLLLAHMIKSLAKRRFEAREAHAEEPARKRRVLPSDALAYVFRENSTAMMTSLVIGFAVLIVLQVEDVPTRGWYDSLALGILLGMLGDENLLGKLRGS